MSTFQSIGIKVTFHEDGDYSADCTLSEFFDPRNRDTALDGRLGTKYPVSDLTQAIDMLKTRAEAMGVDFWHSGFKPLIYVEGDGEDLEVYLPDDWMEQLDAQAKRLGWMTYTDFKSEDCEEEE